MMANRRPRSGTKLLSDKPLRVAKAVYGVAFFTGSGTRS
jgi:hypothetical protein